MGAYAPIDLSAIVKCLVTGATGFIGRDLCRQLQLAGYEFTAFSRSGESLADGVGTRAVDFRTANIDPGSLRGVETVFHLGGIAHQSAQREDYEAVNHRATLALAHLARDAGVRCFVFLSSVRAMGPAGDTVPRGEDDLAPPVDPYGESKRAAETDLESSFADGSMAVYLLRPTLVYAAEAKGNLARLERAIALGLPRPPEEGARSMISREDLVRLMLVAAEQSRPGVHTWIAADGEVYSTRRIYDALRAARGMGQGSDRCPRWVWRLGKVAMQAARGKGQSDWQKLFGTELYRNDRACAESPWRPTLRLEEVLR